MHFNIQASAKIVEIVVNVPGCIDIFLIVEMGGGWDGVVVVGGWGLEKMVSVGA